MPTVIIGAIYEHYSGKKYKVLAIATHSESLEPYVVYQALYDDEHFGSNACWIRPLTMFVENVIIDGIEKSRFKEIAH
jgi:hypothetical protein